MIMGVVGVEVVVWDIFEKYCVFGWRIGFRVVGVVVFFFGGYLIRRRI